MSVPPGGELPTRQRLLRAAMQLFGERGYAATSIAMIEEAAGLSPGSGSLYKHFASKEQLLSEGLDQLLHGTQQLTATLAQAATTERPRPRRSAEARAALVATLADVARAGLARMEQDRDLNRLQFRGLEAFPELMARFRDGELRRVQDATADLLAGLAGPQRADEDWAAVAVVLVGTVAHYWLLRDLYGEHPSGVDEPRFVAAVARVAAAAVSGRAGRPADPATRRG